jgi:Spy/CpxP family protein refolding chaperone
VLTLIVALVIASPVLAGEKGAKKAPKCPAEQQIENITKTLTLTEAQKTKFCEIQKEFGPKLVEAIKAADVLTPEQKKAGEAAAKAAKDAGKDKKEIQQAREEALKITAEQKTKQADLRKQLGAIQKDLREKVMGVLTPEQQEQIKPKKKEKEKKEEKKKDK